MNIALIAIQEASGVFGGMDRFYEGLYSEIVREGHACDIIRIQVSDRTYETILKGYLDCHDLELSKYDGVISTKAPSFMARHENHVNYLNHRIRPFYDLYAWRHEQHERFRDIIHKLDNWALSDANVKRRFCIGQTVREREIKWGGYDPQVIYHPTSGARFQTGDFGDYFLAVSRLNDHKRIDFAIKAVLRNENARLKVVGTGPEEENLKRLAAGSDRIEFLGFVTDELLVEAYRNCRAVIFTPWKEDLGLITIEAFMSGKPVITCEDSGEPAIIVETANGGFVVPDVDGVAAKVRQLMDDAPLAHRLGANGQAYMKTITWETTVRPLIQALSEPSARR